MNKIVLGEQRSDTKRERDLKSSHFAFYHAVVFEKEPLDWLCQ